MILQVDQVSSTEDITVLLVNMLLQQNAQDQHTLANHKPDERLMTRFEEVRSRNTELEVLNRDLRMVNIALVNEVESLKTPLHPSHAEAQAEIETLRLKVNELERRLGYPVPEYITTAISAQGTSMRIMPQAFDGEAVIQEGRAALDRYKEDTRQPDRGE